MKRVATVREIKVASDKRATKLRALPTPAVRRAALTTAHVHAVEEGAIVLALGGALVRATLDASVHPTVMEGARARQERVLVEEAADGTLVVLGALRTQPTPGIDAADAYTIKAQRITLEAGEELTLTAKTAAIAIRAIGEVETYAERIVSRAEGVHKLIGRMLRLN
jgi:hypothetical protein